MWANEFGIIPLSSGDVWDPSIVNVLPVPVWPYANIVPLKPLNTLSTIGRATSLYTSNCRSTLIDHT